MKPGRYSLPFVCLLLCAVYSSNGQTVSDAAAQYRFDPGQLQRLSRAALDTVSGSFSSGGRFYGITYELEKNGTFRKVEYGCMGSFDPGKGSWIIKGKSNIKLHFRHTRKRVVVYRFERLLFLVSPASVTQFKKDLSRVVCQYNEDNKGTPVNNAESSFFIAYSLSKTYFTRFAE